jgi:hypothetical protein
MPNPDTKRQLLTLLDTPDLLSPETRSRIAEQLETMSELKALKLITLLTDGQKQLSEINSNFDRQELPLKEQILHELKEFEHHGIIDAVHQAEQDSEQAKQKNLKNISSQLDEIK